MAKYKAKCEAYESQVDQLKKAKEDEEQKLRSKYDSVEFELRQVRKQVADREAQLGDYEKLIDGQKAKLRSMEAEKIPADTKVPTF